MDSEESHKPKKTHRGWWIAAGIVLLTVAIVALLWFSGQWSLQRKIEALHAKGFPISFEEIEQKRRLPEGTPNAADLYQQAFDAFQQPSAQDLPLLPYFGSGKLPEPGIPLSSDMLNAIERFVVANQKTRSFLEQATDQSYCALPVGCSTPPLPGLDYLEPIYKCGRLLFLNGIRQIEISDFQGAMNTIRNLRYVGNSLCRQPLLQDFVYQRNFVFRNILLVERFLNRGTISEEMLIELNDVLDRNIMPQMAIDAHRNEMPFLMAGLKNPAIYYRTNNLYLKLTD